MIKRIVGLLLVLTASCVANFASSNEARVDGQPNQTDVSSLVVSHEDDDFLLLTIPAVAGAVKREPPPPVVVNPRWSVATEVCCSTSSATFRVNQGSDSRSSTAPSCSVAAPQSSEVESTAGSKSFSFSIDSAGCGRVDNGFSFTFAEKTRYLFVAQFENGGVNINVYSGTINQSTSPEKVVGGEKQGLEHQSTIRLSNKVEGESSFESIVAE